MAKIIRDFGSFTKESSGEFTELNCNKVIKTTLSFTGMQLKKKKIKTVTSYCPDLPHVLADKSQIQQIIVNMITNARDAITHKNGVFKITTETGKNSKGQFVDMKFSDNGCGISKNIIDKLFDPFFTTKRPGGGTGLGLSVVHTIVNNHKGEIFVDSEPGKGTTFTVRLPTVV